MNCVACFWVFPQKMSENAEKPTFSSKFAKNEDLKKLLLATRDAKLMQFIHGSAPESDHILMAVRHELNSAMQN